MNSFLKNGEHLHQKKDLEKKEPLVSVVMTVFNAEKYLAASIESICTQTFSDWEFLIIDDGSTDSSLAIAEAYAAKDARLRVIQNNRNKGQTACLNQGLSAARGKWIARQDADDLSLPTRLEKQMQCVIKNADLMLIGTSGFIINAHNYFSGLLDVPLTHEVIRWSLPLLNPFLHTAVLFHAEAAKFLGGYDVNYRIAQDYDLWSRFIAAGYATKNLSERLICYRHLDASLSKSNQERTLEEITIISNCAAQEIFQKQLTAPELASMQVWRLPKKNKSDRSMKSFWKLYRKLSASLLKENRVIQKDHARFTALLHLDVAGGSSFFSRLGELAAAFVADPEFVINWALARIKPFLFPKNF